ncbi:hypothetical protein [Tropicibacter sp. S64]|uniref:hypothetical protein n=1 Tax=Tropicibacter sp. S64 TaxID=3415122 RepID=UPI003C7E6CC4
MKAILTTLLFATTPALAETVLCGDVAFVTPESIAFVANLKGMEPPPPPRRDVEAALEAESGTIWIISGPEPSEAVRSCLALAERRVPGVTALHQDLADDIDQPIPPEVLEALLLPFPEEQRPALLANGFGDMTTAGHGDHLEAGPWTSHVYVTKGGEPVRSLHAIDSLLPTRGGRDCSNEQSCFDAFADFVTE